MGCTASKPGLVNEFRDVKLEQIQNAKLTPPTVGQVVSQPKPAAPAEAPKKPNLQAQPGFFESNLTFANVVWNSPSTAPTTKPALKSAAPPAAAQPKKPDPQPPAPAPAQPKAAPAPVPAWPVRPDDAWGQDPDSWDDDYDEDEDEEDDAAGRVVDPDMFRTRVNHANFEWEGPEHTDVVPKKDDKQMVNPFAGVPLALPAQAAVKPPAAAAAPAPKASPLEQAANAIKAAEAKDSKAPAPALSSPFAGGAPAAAPKPAAAAKAAAPIASPFAGGAAAKPLPGGAADAQATANAAMQSILMNGTPEQQAVLRSILQNQQVQAQAQAQARSRAQAAFATAPAAGGVYPTVQHASGAQAVPNGYTNEMIMQQIAQARAMQQQQQQQQLLQQQRQQAAANGWIA